MLDWLEKHGEVFLRKNVGIGKNLQKSRAYQKSHETFEGVVQVGQKILIDKQVGRWNMFKFCELCKTGLSEGRLILFQLPIKVIQDSMVCL